MRFVRTIILGLLLAACESNPPAPVIERAPQASKPAPSASSKPTSTKPADTKDTASKDWRPDSYTVKKGDTLFSIGLEYGYDYKEIAAANGIAPPYTIQIAQKLSFASLNNKYATAETKPIARESQDGVIVTPIKAGTVETPISTEIKPTTSAVTPVLTEPKAIREPYSLEAFNRKPAEPKPLENKVAEAKPSETQTIEAKPAETKINEEEGISWIWPTQGKVISSFHEATNKGIDIAGSSGQAIIAAATGKVIYTGSDLRGYGKLVIVKHNKVFLSVYAHNSKIIAKEGQTVSAGQKIAEMGNTDANTVKLHFEIRRQGKSVDPAAYLPQN